MKTTLEDLRLFLRIVELRSLRQVAIEMRTEPSTVTRRLMSLEERLGVRLIQRSRIHSTVTEAGEQYYWQVRNILEQLEEVESKIGQSLEQPSGLVRLSCPIDFGAKHISPWLVELQNIYKSLDFELLLDDKFVDLVESGVDIAIRIGELKDSNLRARKLGVMDMAVVGSSAYFASHDAPRAPEDLENHLFVIYSWLISPNYLHMKRTKRSAKVKMNSRLAINNLGAIMKAVNNHAGLHYGPKWFFQKQLDSGDLVQALPEWELQGYPVHALFKETQNGYVPSKTRKVIDTLVEKVTTIEGIS